MSLLQMRKLFGLLLLATLPAVFSPFALAEGPSTPKPSSESGIEGVIMVGPVQGGPSKQGVPDSRPLGGMEFLVKKENITVTSFKTDDQGRFRISLPPGHYSVSRKDWHSAVGSYGPFEVDVPPGQTKTVQWNCDTGIR
jgi:hypothetical protein